MSKKSVIQVQRLKSQAVIKDTKHFFVWNKT